MNAKEIKEKKSVSVGNLVVAGPLYKILILGMLVFYGAAAFVLSFVNYLFP